MARGSRPPLHRSNERLPLRLSVPLRKGRDLPAAARDSPHEKRRDEPRRDSVAANAAAAEERHFVQDLVSDILRVVRAVEDFRAKYSHEHGLGDHFYAF